MVFAHEIKVLTTNNEKAAPQGLAKLKRTYPDSIFISLVKDKGQILNIEDVILHPGYQQEAYQDVCVIKLKTSQCKLNLKIFTFLLHLMYNDMLKG